ncbi:MAG: NFACT family protein, partial [Acidobacteria bacterium]|nr:NFACT family protein [Acidobacteriota bacterium]
MDNFLLHAVVAELESKLSGSQSRARIGRMWQYGSSGLLIDLQRRDGKLLAVSVDPNLLGIYLTSSTSRQFGDEPATDTQFIALLKKYLGGGVLRSIEKLGYDRLVRFEFTVETDGGEQVDRQLIVLLTGRAANVLITENDQIIAALKQREDKSGVFIEPVPPADRIDPFQCSSEKLDQLIADSANDIALAAQNNLIGFSPLYARELAARSSGKSPHAALEELLSEIFEKPHHPRIYSSPSLEILRSKEGLPEFAMIVAPIILTHHGDLHQEEFESINDAADAYFKILNSRRKFTAIKQKISSRLTAKIKKVRTLISNLQRERESFKNAEIHQRYGDLLLANLHQAVKTENGFSVTDFFDASQATIEIPSANKPTARDAAEQYFKLAR